MSHLDEWAQSIAKQLKSEAELVSAQAKSDLYQDVAREAFVRVALEPFLPGSYAVGSGRVIDSAGNISSPQDIVIFRRDYPQFNMPGSHNVFIYESVLATIQVSSKLVRKSFFNALDQCASMGGLNPVIDPATLRGMASKMKMQLDAKQQYIHPDPLNTGRFNLIGRPQSFVYAFTGYQTSDRQLAENLVKWIDLYHEDHSALQMKSLPSVIATQGCFAWRNTAPFPIKKPALLGVGIDHAPVRLIILQLMHALNRRLQNTSDGYGIKSNISPYLNQFEPPAISEMIGEARNPGNVMSASKQENKTEQVAAKRNSPLPGQSHSTAQMQANEKGAGTVKPESFASQKDSSNVVQLADAESQGSHNSRPTVAQQKPAPATVPSSATTAATEQHSQPQGIAPKPDSREIEKAEPVIKNLSTPWPARADAKVSSPSDSSHRPKTSSPLSSFNDAGEEEVDEYQFNPIDRHMPHSDEAGADEAADSDDDGFLSTQVINTAGGNHDSEGRPEAPKTGQLSTQKEQGEDEEVDSSFLDTLVDTAESLANNESEPSSSKSKYVTESLI